MLLRRITFAMPAAHMHLLSAHGCCCGMVARSACCTPAAHACLPIAPYTRPSPQCVPHVTALHACMAALHTCMAALHTCMTQVPTRVFAQRRYRWGHQVCTGRAGGHLQRACVRAPALQPALSQPQSINQALASASTSPD